MSSVSFSCTLCLCVFSRQLPHMPHISECLMKRSLKPTDLRDMTLGQLQVIVNDLHSQIESELTTNTPTVQCIHTYTESLASTFICRNEQESEWGKTCTCILTPTLSSGCESTFIYVSQFKELYQSTASPQHLLSRHYTDH